SGQLNLDAVLQQQRVNLLRARFIVDHHAERGGAPGIARQVQAIDLAAERHTLAVAQVNFPRGQRVAIVAESQFDSVRIEAVLLHPAHGRLDEILQRELETARSEEVLGVSAEHAFAKRADKFVGDAAHTFARFLRREVAPAFALGAQLLVETGEDLVLKTALLADISLKQSALFGAQAGAYEKLERTGGELLQRARRSAEHRAVEVCGERGRERVTRAVSGQSEQTLSNVKSDS